MNKTTIKQKTEAPFWDWTEHLCYIVAQGFDVGDREMYKSLINKPQFRCRHCGRLAHNDRNLCIPMVYPNYGSDSKSRMKSLETKL